MKNLTMYDFGESCEYNFYCNKETGEAINCCDYITENSCINKETIKLKELPYYCVHTNCDRCEYGNACSKYFPNVKPSDYIKLVNDFDEEIRKDGKK